MIAVTGLVVEHVDPLMVDVGHTGVPAYVVDALFVTDDLLTQPAQFVYFNKKKAEKAMA